MKKLRRWVCTTSRTLRGLWQGLLLFLLLSQGYLFMNLSYFVYQEQSDLNSNNHLNESPLNHRPQRNSWRDPIYDINQIQQQRQLSQEQYVIPRYNHTFPRWGREGIDLEAILEFIQDLEDQVQVVVPVPSLFYHTVTSNETMATTTIPPTDDFWNDNDDNNNILGPGVSFSQRPSLSQLTKAATKTSSSFSPPLVEYFPHTPYMFDADGVWVSRTFRKRTAKHQIPHRVLPFELALQRAWNHLRRHYLYFDYLNSRQTNQHQQEKDENGTPILVKDKWPRLRRTVIVNNTGFPMIVWQGDFKDCNYQNYRGSSSSNNNDDQRRSIPIFTTCAHVNCTHAFPFPTYKTVEHAQEMPRHWDAVFVNQSAAYPFALKIRQLVWRGSLSGPLLNYTSPRSRLAVFAARHGNSSLLNIGLSKIPRIHYNSSSSSTSVVNKNNNKKKGSSTLTMPHDDSHVNADINLTALGGLLPQIPQADFQKYLAVLDTDGNSWSSRFGSLLCSSSIVVKVEPQYADYFYKYLTPWKHYVPVRYDLSDLMDRVEWVLDPANAAAVQAVIRTANKWCRAHMTHSSISVDILDILDAYVGYMDAHNPNWMQAWNSSKARLMAGGRGSGAGARGDKDLQMPNKLKMQKLEMDQLLRRMLNHKRRRRNNGQRQARFSNSSSSPLLLQVDGSPSGRDNYDDDNNKNKDKNLTRTSSDSSPSLLEE